MPNLKMTVEIANVNWFLGQDPPEGTVTFKTESGKLLDAFSYGQTFIDGEIADVEFTTLDYGLEWGVVFSNNRQKERRLNKGQNAWEYEAYGEIKSIHPVIIDFGDIKLDTGNWTNDEKVIGEFVYWKIDRLDILKTGHNTGF